MRLLGKTEIDFLSYRPIGAVLSLIAIVVSLGSIAAHGGLRYGIDFAGGTQVIVLFAERPEIDDLRIAVVAWGGQNLTSPEGAEPLDLGAEFLNQTFHVLSSDAD